MNTQQLWMMIPRSTHTKCVEKWTLLVQLSRIMLLQV
ncbi:uncharacterized protein M6B38_350625 [Iris pallida]|uniref:Uncharacterized protein n=1 Tax=Iris pallida TaxID=29817 RepID=A0AAX6GRJ2_IRIPA|nr:uncharacterized protein M6B38_350625 [Iris pallida]